MKHGGDQLATIGLISKDKTVKLAAGLDSIAHFRAGSKWMRFWTCQKELPSWARLQGQGEELNCCIFATWWWWWCSSHPIRKPPRLFPTRVFQTCSPEETFRQNQNMLEGLCIQSGPGVPQGSPPPPRPARIDFIHSQEEWLHVLNRLPPAPAPQAALFSHDFNPVKNLNVCLDLIAPLSYTVPQWQHVILYSVLQLVEGNT